MSEENITLLLKQLRAVMLDKPITADMKINGEDFRELEEGLAYLANCLQEMNGFLGDLCAGNLNSPMPGRHNFLAGRLKELHAILKHLTWQTKQVADGDYNQQVIFLGEFSESFNKMVMQLRERELSISAKNQALSQSMNLLKSVLDGQREWVVVVEAASHQVIYTNLSAKKYFYDPEKDTTSCGRPCDLLAMMRERIEGEEVWEYECPIRNIVFSIRSTPIEWHGQQAFVHSFSDITDEKEEKEQLHTMAYQDELTGIYNRRYCLKKVMKLLIKDLPFSLAMVDLDGLKAVNDGQGHGYGDDYIITVAHTIIEALSENDQFCRIGGDEFVAIFPESREADAARRLEAAAETLQRLEKPYPISISYGIIETDGTTNATPEELFTIADEKMYQMKQEHKK